MPLTDYYFHVPGTPGLGAVLDVGLHCTHSCKFCYYSFYDSAKNQFQALRKGGFRSLSDCLEILSAIAAHGLKHVDVTGGEPTLHPGIVDIARHAVVLGLGFRIITLGQFLLQTRSDGQTLLERLLNAGTADFLFSIHAAAAGPFKDFTGGSFAKLSSVLESLQKANFQFGTNTVVFQDNLSMLPEIARYVAARGAYIHNFILFNAYYRWATIPQIAGMQPRFEDVYPPLREAVNILVEAGVAVNIRYAPMCVLPGLERHIVGVAGVPYDPYEWRNRACNYEREPAYCAEPLPLGADGAFPSYALRYRQTLTEGGLRAFAVRGEGLKIFPEPCRNCAALAVCDGMDPRYADLHGLSELSPYVFMETNGPLAKARLTYEPPHFVKMGPMADMKGIIAAGS